MTHNDPTDLKELTAQVRAYPLLSAGAAESLLTQARSHRESGAERELVEHHLGLALDAAVARAGRGVEVVDLYQEGSIAVVTAVSAFVRGQGAAKQLRAVVVDAIEVQLEAALAQEKAVRMGEESMISAARVFTAARVHLRNELDRPPTNLELAAALKWEPEFVETVAQKVGTAAQIYDSELVAYLDDAEEG